MGETFESLGFFDPFLLFFFFEPMPPESIVLITGPPGKGNSGFDC